MVLEFVDHDLHAVQQRVKNSPHKLFPIGDVKQYMFQLLRGLSAIHKRQILHRDLKCANLLVRADGVLKIADFGLSRMYEPDEGLTPQVCTLWYRPPELLLAGCELPLMRLDVGNRPFLQQVITVDGIIVRQEFRCTSFLAGCRTKPCAPPSYVSLKYLQSSQLLPAT